ncbi:Transcription elongation factor spt6 [Penicillium taxi]|uniref:Transcription elongation factor spt6 n=1 Tax=Penicillium taxi TaxID=168475 RepID=UPI002544E0D9|nr:Transcription elongation factor spt6 [Penicillium taxi]KAJ5885265.1 Transcription elongation factor spt6 [Penicillium taxi]
MSLRDLVEGEASLDEDENDVEMTGDAGEGSRSRNHYSDSSEEEEDDDDPEANARVREGFIIDDDEDEIEHERARRRRENKKRSRPREEEHLDDEDLELIGEVPNRTQPAEPKLKRLRRHKDRDSRGKTHDIGDIFNSDEDEEPQYGRHTQGGMDDMGDFIEEDTFSDEEGQREEDDPGVAAPFRATMPGGVGAFDVAGLDENAIDDLRLAFGDGTDYMFALEIEDQEDEEKETNERHLDLKDVFEPSELKQRMLTEDDNEIRQTDEPERHQIARKPYKHVVLTEDQFREEAIWISNLMLLKKRLDPDLREPFQRAVAKMLEFLITDDWEVPFIFQHRKDYMIHAMKEKEPSNDTDPTQDSGQYDRAVKLMVMTDLWDIFDNDLKFRALIDKRNSIQNIYDNLQSLSKINDPIIEDLLTATTMEELQDLQDYIHFQYPTQLRDLTWVNNGDTRRKASTKNIYERVRNGKAYGLVRAFGITAEAFAQNASKEGRRQYTEDPSERPEELADQFVDSDFPNSAHVLKAAKSMFAEEIVQSPKMRKTIRQAYYMNGVVDCFRTEKGLRRIDEQHPYYEFKYLRNQQLSDIARRPEMFLRMLKAEEEGLVDVKVHFENFDQFRKRLYADIESDNYSEVADAWNRIRREALDLALAKIERIINRSVKENVRQECENHVGRECRDAFAQRLDQAPYKPKGMVLGTVPRVVTFTVGPGTVGRDPIHWAYIEEDGRVLENGKIYDILPRDEMRGTPDGKDVAFLVKMIERRKPDVIGVSGVSPEARRLFKLLYELVKVKDIRGAPYTNDEDKEVSDPLEVIIINDEVARLYYTSPQARQDNPGFTPLTHYCVGLGRYMQSPLKEYASLGRDIVSIQFKPGQQLIPQELLLKQLETALVDMVNLVGVDLNEAIHDRHTANLLPYVCGLGPRKAAHLLKVINLNGGVVNNRVELLGVNTQYPPLTVKVWNNCASFVYLDYENADMDADPLDNTRVHPEDYDIARKMAADALELDEEDIKAETDENGSGAIVRKLFRDEQQDRVNDLILEEYAEQLEKNLNQRKRATLETIRAELQQPYEELRKQFVMLGVDDIFTMLTGETDETLAIDMVVPISIKRVFEDHIDAKLDCGVDALVAETELGLPYDVSVRSVYQTHQTVSAKVIMLNKKSFTCNVTLRSEEVTSSRGRRSNHGVGDWDDAQERKDRESQVDKTQQGGQAMRVIKHPLFHPFNATQAEEYLGSHSRGDMVIRPSSRGRDHLAVTWKVAQGVYQHIDVLELDKENEFSVGRVLKVGGKYTYSDLDDLIVNHVKAMAKKVDEMILHEKYQEGSKADTDQWLETYTRANPRRSTYVFCINPKYPGYFYLCFKAGEHARLQHWPVKVIPQGYELQKNPYPDMQALCNGFKLMFQNMQARRR